MLLFLPLSLSLPPQPIAAAASKKAGSSNASSLFTPFFSSFNLEREGAGRVLDATGSEMS
jgi:hypothetical protein